MPLARSSLGASRAASLRCASSAERFVTLVPIRLTSLRFVDAQSRGMPFAAKNCPARPPSAAGPLARLRPPRAHPRAHRSAENRDYQGCSSPVWAFRSFGDTVLAYPSQTDVSDMPVLLVSCWTLARPDLRRASSRRCRAQLSPERARQSPRRLRNPRPRSHRGQCAPRPRDTHLRRPCAMRLSSRPCR